jgi:hypothetical protein
MLAEHLIYSAALAILIGMLFVKFTGRDYSWIIILFAFAPDSDIVVPRILRAVGINFRFEGYPIFHGAFHTLGAMVLFGIIAGLFLSAFEIPTFDAILLSTIGFGAHLVEDALVYSDGYSFLWPVISGRIGLGWLVSAMNEESYNATFFHIANTDVLLIGIEFLFLAMIIRTLVEGEGWIRWYMPEKVYRYFFARKSPA